MLEIYIYQKIFIIDKFRPHLISCITFLCDKINTGNMLTKKAHVMFKIIIASWTKLIVTFARYLFFCIYIWKIFRQPNAFHYLHWYLIVAIDVPLSHVLGQFSIFNSFVILHKIKLSRNPKSSLQSFPWIHCLRNV